MADDDLEKEVKRLRTFATEVRKKGEGVSKQIETLIKAIEAYPEAAPPNVKAKGWSKKAKTLGAEPATLKKLEDAEKAGTRASLDAAYKLVAKEKKLDAIAKEIKKLLDSDAAGGKQLEALITKAKSEEGNVKKIEADAGALKVEKV